MGFDGVHRTDFDVGKPINSQAVQFLPKDFADGPASGQANQQPGKSVLSARFKHARGRTFARLASAADHSGETRKCFLLGRLFPVTVTKRSRFLLFYMTSSFGWQLFWNVP
jgi:hypothetical protein